MCSGGVLVAVNSRWILTEMEKVESSILLQVCLDLRCICFFFFQAEDGIRDLTVTGVQTCALPILLPDAEGKHLRVFALDFPDSKGFFREETLIPIEGTHPGEAFRTRKPVVKAHHDSSEERYPEHYQRVVGEGVKSGCLVPLISRDRSLGVLALGRRQDSDFDREEVEFLCQVAGQVAIAVENALAYGEIAELRDKLAQEKLYLEEEIREIGRAHV